MRDPYKYVLSLGAALACAAILWMLSGGLQAQSGGGSTPTFRLGTGTLTYASGCTSGGVNLPYNWTLVANQIVYIRINPTILTCVATGASIVFNGVPTNLQPSSSTGSASPKIAAWSFVSGVPTLLIITIPNGGQIQFLPAGAATVTITNGYEFSYALN
jgi:hypothetical protein